MIINKDNKTYRIRNDGNLDQRYKASRGIKEKGLTGTNVTRTPDNIVKAKTIKKVRSDKWQKFKKRLGIFCFFFAVSSIAYVTYTVGMIPVRYVEAKEQTRILNIKRPIQYSCVADCDDPIINEPVISLLPAKQIWTGQASWYGEDAGECLGCSPTLTMANGERFNEDEMTLAFNQLPLNTTVNVTNTNTNKTVEATVTDTGGFEPLGRIADLSEGLKDALGCSDLCQVEIVEVE